MGFAAALCAAAACGKKGPPLAPLIPIPAAIEAISAERAGNAAFVTVTLPATNVDQFKPADLARVEIFGYTGRTAPPRTQWVELGTLVATVPVKPPPPTRPDEPPKEVTPGIPGDAPLQGESITIRDTLTPEELVQGSLPRIDSKNAEPRTKNAEPRTPNPEPRTANAEPRTANAEPRTPNPEPRTANAEPRTANAEPRTPNPEPPTPNPEPRTPNLEPRTPNLEPGTEPQNTNPEPGTRNPELPLKRFYTAFPFSERGRPGPPGAVAEFPVIPVPDPPRSVDVEYSERETVISWEPSGGLIGFLLERTLIDEVLPAGEEEGEEPAAASPSPVLAGPVLYNVYRDTASADWFAPPPQVAALPWHESPPTPVNPTPLATLSFVDGSEFNRARCYTVSGVRAAGAEMVVGDSSPPVCVVAIDVFPPSPPRGLATVASVGAIDLIWEPNTDFDLGGYVVLRGEAPGDTLQPLTMEPVHAASFKDDSVTSGVRYVYAVVATDNRFPVPNVSGESERIEETAR